MTTAAIISYHYCVHSYSEITNLTNIASLLNYKKEKEIYTYIPREEEGGK